MLLADDKGASLIVAVGTHATLVEFLDKGRAGHGQHVPDPAAGGRQARRRQGRQPALPQPDLRRRHCSLLVAATLVTMVVAIVVLAGGQGLAETVVARLVERLRLLADRTLHVIDFRYHLVSIVAVFLALALGIVVGATALRGPLVDELKDNSNRLKDSNEVLRKAEGRGQRKA